jgi:uncharacterized protein YdhG (YjbR/CyaY superfamily)
MANDGFSKEEKAAMRERAKELKANATREEELAEVLKKIAAMDDVDRPIAERIHEIVLKAAPSLNAKTWYGMQAYFKDGKVVCFFQDAGKFKSRYCTFGFQDAAKIDDGAMWATSFAVLEMTSAVEKQIAELVKRSVS